MAIQCLVWMCVSCILVIAYLLHKHRSSTPGIIYMDYNGTTPIHPKALQEYFSVCQRYFGNPSTACVAGRRANEVLENSRADIASEVGCKQTELVFTSGATESNIIVLRGFVANSRNRGRRCHIVTTPIEHASVTSTIESLNEQSAYIYKVSVDRYGTIDMNNLSTILGSVDKDEDVLLSIIWINNEIGTIQDVYSIIKLCRSICPDAFIHLDGTQVIGRYLVELSALDADSVSFSAHKFRGPHGIGALYLRSSDALMPVMTGGKQEKGLRGGTENVAAVASMAVALKASNDLLRSGAANDVFKLKNHMLTRLVEVIPNIIVNSHPDRCAFNTLSVCLPCDSRLLIEHLSNVHGVCLAVGSACSKGGVSGTLQAIGVTKKALRGSLRISLGFENSLSECEHVLSCISEYLGTIGCPSNRV